MNLQVSCIEQDKHYGIYEELMIIVLCAVSACLCVWYICCVVGSCSACVVVSIRVHLGTHGYGHHVGQFGKPPDRGARYRLVV